jgi:hypothetical protein
MAIIISTYDVCGSRECYEKYSNYSCKNVYGNIYDGYNIVKFDYSEYEIGHDVLTEESFNELVNKHKETLDKYIKEHECEDIIFVPADSITLTNIDIICGDNNIECYATCLESLSMLDDYHQEMKCKEDNVDITSMYMMGYGPDYVREFAPSVCLITLSNANKYIDLHMIRKLMEDNDNA